MKQLYEKVRNNPELLAQVMEILSKAEEAGREQTQKALLAFAEEQGYEVTAEEVKAFFEGMTASGQLSDGELDMVAGGKTDDGIMTVMISVFSLGLGCAIASLVKMKECSEFFE